MNLANYLKSFYLIALILSNFILPASGKFNYPETKRVDHIDDYNGIKVEDPYRWLEQDVRNSDEVKQWVEAQNKISFDYLQQLPQRERIVRRMTQLWNYPTQTAPEKIAGNYFFKKNDGLQNQAVLYRQKSLNDAPEIILDPNTWSKDGTVALSNYTISPNGRYLAYGIQDSGSDWRKWRILDLEKKQLLDETLSWLKFTNVTWSKDSKGFFYGRYPEPKDSEKFQSLNLNQKIYFHKLRTQQSDDQLIYERPDQPEWVFFTNISDDGHYLIITIWHGTDPNFQVVYKDLTLINANPIELIGEFKHEYSFIGNDKTLFYFITNEEAPRSRLIAIDINKPNRKYWQEIIPTQDMVLAEASIINHSFVIHYLKDVHSQVLIYDKKGELKQEMTLPGIGSIEGLYGGADDTETFYLYSSFNTPKSVYRYDFKTNNSKLVEQVSIIFEPENYIVKQVFYPSKDGTKIPMFISYKKNIQLTGNTPTLLYGYGGFNISLLPKFDVSRFAWMDMGGIYAVANIRGGGEYGEQWHRAGTKLKKQNVFDDFIGAAEYLIKEKYTNPAKLGIFGGSNGGLLVGAVINQRPDLFAAAIPAVGVMDMLRFDQFTAGRFWIDDYGSPSKPEEFKALYAYSPYHNIQENIDYPAILVATADTDDRVVPSHSFKYISALQHAYSGDKPVLIRIENKAGHSAGKPTRKRIEEYADYWAFMLKNMNVNLAQELFEN